MKIIIDCTSTQDQFANRGIGVYTNEIVRGLLSYTSRMRCRDTYNLLLFDGSTTLEKTIREYSDIVQTVNIGQLRLSDKFNSIWWHKQFKPAIRSLLSNEHIDLYFCPYFWRGFPAKQIPTVVMIHDLAFPVMNRYSTAPKYLDWIRKLQYHASLNRVADAKRVITNSKQTKKDLLKYVDVSGRKVVPIYLGTPDRVHEVNPDTNILLKYLPREVVDTGYIIYYAGLETNKNVPALIRSYNSLIKMWEAGSGDSARTSKQVPFLVLAGGDFTKLDIKNSVLSEVRNLIRDFCIDDYVYFTGFFEDEDLSDLLCGSRLFMHLSKYEGFGFAPIEAMKCGVPVVASNRSCYPEVLGDAAVLVDPSDPDKVARAAYQVLVDSKIAKTLSKKGKAQAGKYDWKLTAQKTYNLFEEIVDSGATLQKKLKILK